MDRLLEHLFEQGDLPSAVVTPTVRVIVDRSAMVSTPVIRSVGTSRPHRKICGPMNGGMNCIAWNSVRATALASRRQRRRARFVSTARRTSTSMMPTTSTIGTVMV